MDRRPHDGVDELPRKSGGVGPALDPIGSIHGRVFTRHALTAGTAGGPSRCGRFQTEIGGAHQFPTKAICSEGLTEGAVSDSVWAAWGNGAAGCESVERVMVRGP